MNRTVVVLRGVAAGLLPALLVLAVLPFLPGPVAEAAAAGEASA